MASGISTHVDLAGSIENVQRAATDPSTYPVDVAKVEALDMMGETEKAVQLMDRHIWR